MNCGVKAQSSREQVDSQDDWSDIFVTSRIAVLDGSASELSEMVIVRVEKTIDLRQRTQCGEETSSCGVSVIALRTL